MATDSHIFPETISYLKGNLQNKWDHKTKQVKTQAHCLKPKYCFTYHQLVQASRNYSLFRLFHFGIVDMFLYMFSLLKHERLRRYELLGKGWYLFKRSRQSNQSRYLEPCLHYHSQQR